MMLRTKPLFGVGYGAFTDHHERTAHNSFVLCFSELGLIGYFIWLAMIVSALLDVNVVAEAPAGALQPELLSAAGMLRASLVGFLSCAWFLSRTYAPPLFILLALCGAAWGCANEHAPDKGSIRPPRWVPRTASALLGSIAVVYLMVMIKHAG
jgi:putative inorganic carbon (HCO3(-)) transporter